MTGEGSIAQVLAGEARWNVTCGDCLEVLPTLADGCVDHVITDPPYTDRVSRGARTGSMHDNFITFGGVDGLEPRIAQHATRLARRWSIVWCAFEQLGTYASAVGDRWVRSGVWRKPNATPQFTGDRPAMCGEACAIMHSAGRKRWNGHGRPAFWQYPTETERNGHPTPKPIGLMLELVSDFTDPDDLIIDPFAGSGTTGVAALRIGRRVILIEREQRWADLCRERLRAEEQGSTLQARKAGQEPLFK